MNKFIFIDTETTGLDPKANGIYQLSGHIYINDKIVETFDLKCSPFDKDIYDDVAVKMSGKSIVELKSLENPIHAYSKFITMLHKYVDKYDKKDKFFFVGYNAMFDMQMLRSWFEKNRDTYFGSWFWYPPLDVMTLAAWHSALRRKDMKDFKLATVCEAYNVTLDSDGRFHDAMFDINATFELAKRFAPALFSDVMGVPEIRKSQECDEDNYLDKYCDFTNESMNG